VEGEGDIEMKDQEIIEKDLVEVQKHLQEAEHNKQVNAQLYKGENMAFSPEALHHKLENTLSS
jgi:hypothetical protein